MVGAGDPFSVSKEYGKLVACRDWIAGLAGEAGETVSSYECLRVIKPKDLLAVW